MIPGRLALAVVEVARHRGVAPELLLDGVGAGLDQLAAPGARIGVDAFTGLVRRGEALTGDPALVCYAGQHLHLGSLGFLGVAVMTAPTLGDALQLGQRFAPVDLFAFDFDPCAAGGEATLSVIESRPLAELSAPLVLALAVAIGRIAADVAGRPVARRLEVTFAAPAYYDRLAHLLPPEVRFGQPRTRLVFDAGALGQPLRSAAPGAAAVERVCELLVKPERGVRSIEEVARLMRVSTRTLRRQLAASSTTFSELTATRRLAIARVMLADRRCSIGAIAARLGYSDIPNFTRAFKRWTGTTPARARITLTVTASGASA